MPLGPVSRWLDPAVLSRHRRAGMRNSLAGDGLAIGIVDDVLRRDVFADLLDNAADCVRWTPLFRLYGDGHHTISVSERQWREAAASDRFLRYLYEDGPRAGCEMARPYLLHMMFSAFLRSPDWLRWLEDFTGVGCRDSDIPVLKAHRAGDLTTRHSDNTRGRVLCAIFYLSRGWRRSYGGQLVFHPLDGNEIVVEPLANRLVVFKPAERVTHEVTTVTPEDPTWRRYSYAFCVRGP